MPVSAKDGLMRTLSVFSVEIGGARCVETNRVSKRRKFIVDLALYKNRWKAGIKIKGYRKYSPEFRLAPFISGRLEASL